MPGRLERQLRLVELALVRGRLRFGEAVAALAPVSSATIARLLRELCATGMLRRDADGSYLPGGRPAGWSARLVDEVPSQQRAAIDALGRTLACTATLWAVHDRSLRCRYRALDEHSPALSSPGNVRPVTLAVIGGGLVMTAAELADQALLRSHARATPLQPGDAAIRRVVAGCRRGIYDDRAGFYPGSRRLAVLAAGGTAMVAVALAAPRVRLAAQREGILAAMRRAAAALAGA